MKVVRGVVTSISLLAALSLTARPAHAAEATCAEQYLSCVNDASQVDGFWARTWAEQKCNSGWYSCMRRQAIGA